MVAILIVFRFASRSAQILRHGLGEVLTHGDIIDTLTLTHKDAGKLVEQPTPENLDSEARKRRIDQIIE